ncbi:MAG: C39 family peptidase [Pseudobdellovibrionaceae bacterium]|nr:C39 family peptidase [Pseudobdellovibrionaceae bacterium]
MNRILSASALALSLSAKGSTINTLKPVTEFQTDSWSCGVHSTYRSLNNFGLADSYRNLRSYIGQHKFKYSVAKEITERVEEKVCEKLGPFEHFCKEVTKVVTRVTTVNIPLELGIGRGPDQLAAKISDYGVRSIATESATLSDIEGLIDRKKPVLVLLQIDVAGWELISFPKLHWVVVTGYDNNKMYYYDTDTNKQLDMEKGEFFKQWDWNNDWNKRNSPVHLHLTRNEGLEVRSIIKFEDEKIDRVILLEELEARAEAKINTVMNQAKKQLSDPMIQDVNRKTNFVEQANRQLEEDAEDVLRLIGSVAE